MAGRQAHSSARRTALGLLLAGGLAGCSGGIGISFGSGYWWDGNWWDDGWQEIDFTVVDSSGRSGVTASGLRVARDISAWAVLWEAHTAPLDPAPPLPSVNFASRMVAGVFAGQRASPCARIHVTRVLWQGSTGRIHIDAATSTDTGQCSLAPGPSAPAELVLLPWSSAEVDVAIDE